VKVFESSTNVRDLLGKVTQQEAGATDLLFQHCMERMRVLAHRLFQSRKDLHLFEESDDLLQKTLVRLHRAIHVLKPSTTRAFMTIALQNMRWALKDLARDMHDRLDKLGNSKALAKAPSLEEEPSTLLEWSFFHDAIQSLPQEERETFDLIFYGGMQQEEAAEFLGVSTRTIKRRWRLARILLAKALDNEWPNLD
jgi:RNA polymerase sigma factor (sigma-70 family)